jgi:hypothetical protein
LTAAAAALALSLSAGATLADDADNDTPVLAQPSTVFDLGVDVSNVGGTPAAVQRFLSSLEPETQRVIMSTCDHYMEAPVTATEQNTLTFCSLATGGG